METVYRCPGSVSFCRCDNPCRTVFFAGTRHSDTRFAAVHAVLSDGCDCRFSAGRHDDVWIQPLLYTVSQSAHAQRFFCLYLFFHVYGHHQRCGTFDFCPVDDYGTADRQKRKIPSLYHYITDDSCQLRQYADAHRQSAKPFSVFLLSDVTA